jgi:hypothetical protein
MGAAFGELEERPGAAECSDGAPDRATGDGVGRGRDCRRRGVAARLGLSGHRGNIPPMPCSF